MLYIIHTKLHFCIIVLSLVHFTKALPPFIIKQQDSNEILYQVVSNGNYPRQFSLLCEAGGDPPPKYRWTKNGDYFNVTAYESRIEMEVANGTLTFRVPENDDEGIYQCFAKNKHGYATFNPYVVRKTFLKNFKDTLIDVIEVHAGQSLKLECLAPDGYPKPSVRWIIQTFGYGDIETVENPSRAVDPDGNLWFSSVQYEDAFRKAYYVCIATTPKHNEYKLGRRVQLKIVHANRDGNDDDDSSGDRESDDKSRVNSSLIFMQYVSQPHIVVLRGQRTELFCIYGGSPTLNVIWRFNGTAISYDKRVMEQNSGKSLLIRDTRINDQGIYTCDVSDESNENKTSLFNVDVLAKPYFITYPRSVSAVENETSSVEFICEVRGSPAPDIVWTHNGNVLMLHAANESAAGERFSAEKNKLTIKDLIKSDTGNYGCNATNTLGYAYEDFYLDITKTKSSL